MSTPTRRALSARATSGNATATLPRSARSLRRLIADPKAHVWSVNLAHSGSDRVVLACPPMSPLGQSRLGEASCKSSHVRNAPLATVGPKRRPVVKCQNRL
jgi:hypothetical protein